MLSSAVIGIILVRMPAVGLLFLRIEIRSYKHLKKLVTVDMTNKTSCVIIGGYVSRVLRQNITNDLIYGIIAFLGKSVINDGEIFSQFCLFVFVTENVIVLSNILSAPYGKNNYG